MPRGFKTEDGPRPEFVETYGAKQTPSPDYSDRTAANVCDSDATLWFGSTTSPGYRATLKAVRFYKTSRPMFAIGTADRHADQSEIVDWLGFSGVRVLNVAGNRESSSPGIGAWVESYLCEVFRLLGLEEIEKSHE